MPGMTSMDKFFLIRCLCFLHLSRAALTVCPFAHAPFIAFLANTPLRAQLCLSPFSP